MKSRKKPSKENRKQLIARAKELLASGATLVDASSAIKKDVRTLARWRKRGLLVVEDRPTKPSGEAGTAPLDAGNVRTTEQDGQALTDIPTILDPAPTVDPDFPDDPVIRSNLLGAARERSKAAFLVAATARQQAEDAYQTSRSLAQMRAQKSKKVERSWHKASSDALLAFARLETEDASLYAELSAWNWQRGGGGAGNPYKDKGDPRSEGWDSGWAAALSTDPTKAQKTA